MKSNQQNKKTPKQSTQATIEPSANSTIPPAMSINQIIQFIFSNLAIFTAILTIAGFFTIQSYLATFSAFSYNIPIATYIGAGMSFITGFMFYLSYNTIPNTLPLPIFMILSIIILVGLYLIARKQKSMRVALFIAAIAFLFIYGRSYYVQIPRYLGGGEPVNVIVVFDEAQSTQDLIWGFPINTAIPRQSEQVQLLMELTDGVIVRHGSDGDVVMVKNDVINAIIYPNNTPTPTPPPTSTP